MKHVWRCEDFGEKSFTFSGGGGEEESAGGKNALLVVDAFDKSAGNNALSSFGSKNFFILSPDFFWASPRKSGRFFFDFHRAFGLGSLARLFTVK